METRKQARKIRVFISGLTKKFPPEERFRLKDQLISCSISIGNNIAEGHGRFHYQDNVRFCIIARGALSDTLDHLIVALDENYINADTFKSFEAEYDYCLRLLMDIFNLLKGRKMMSWVDCI